MTEDAYIVTQNLPEASIVIQNTKAPPLSMTVNLTSPLVREKTEKGEKAEKGEKGDVAMVEVKVEEGGKAAGQAPPPSRAPLATSGPSTTQGDQRADRQGVRQTDWPTSGTDIVYWAFNGAS